MSDGDKKPGVSNIGDLKARLGQLKQGGESRASENPFAAAPSNPFAAASMNQQGGAQPQQPPSLSSPFGGSQGQGSANPFAAAQLLPKGGSQASQNPFAASALVAPASNNANPFVVQPAAPSAPAPAPAPTAPMNPFGATSPSVSANPFGAQEGGPSGAAQANPFEAQNVSADVNPFEAQIQESAPQQPAETPEMVAQRQAVQELAPLKFSSYEYKEPESEFSDAISSGFNNTTIQRKVAIFMLVAGVVVALIIGLLMGSAVSQRRSHNLRVKSWIDINESLKVPFDHYNQIEDAFTKMLRKKEIQWKLLEGLPKNLKPISPSLLATPAPLEEKALIELSASIHELNLLFSQVKEHRDLSLALRSELKAFENGKGFEQYRQYAVYAESFFSGCIKKKKMRCKAPVAGSPPRGRIVAIAGQKLKTVGKKKKIDVVSRKVLEPKAVIANYLIEVPKLDVTGFGENVIYAYTLRLKKIKERLDLLRKIKRSFDKTLKEKLSLEEIITI